MIEKKLNELFEQLSKDLISKYDELGMRASGAWAKSHEITVKNNTATLKANDYTDQLQFGRRPGSLPPVQSIEEWIKEKQVDFSWARNITAAAWAIAKSIQFKGTKYFQQGGTDLISSVITPERIQKMIDSVGVLLTAEFASVYVDELKNTLA